MVFDRTLIAPSDKNQRVDPCRDSLFGRILDQRLVDDWQEFFRQGFGGRQKACAETGNRKYGFADRFHVRSSNQDVLIFILVSQSDRPQMVRRNRNAGLSTHDLHQNPKAPVWRNFFYFCDDIRKWSLGQHYLFARLQKLWLQQFAVVVAAQHELGDQFQRHGRWCFAETY